jgi:hypothetical protein
MKIDDFYLKILFSLFIINYCKHIMMESINIYKYNIYYLIKLNK